MQISGNQDAIAKQYAQAIQGNSVAAAKSTKAVDDGTAVAAAATEQKESSKDVDKAAFSKEADITKMSDSERAKLVDDMKADLENQSNRFVNMMMQTFNKQGQQANLANGKDFWKMMSSGNFTVDAKTKAEATAAVSEDGFWGVSQTSQRIFDFAHAIAGDDVEKMKEYQKAVEKGFQQAGAAWGGSLPAISGQTKSAVDKLFADYYEQNS